MDYFRLENGFLHHDTIQPVIIFPSNNSFAGAGAVNLAVLLDVPS